MGQSAKQVYRLAGQGAMYSPGAPSLGYEIECRFWRQIATVTTGEKAAEAVPCWEHWFATWWPPSVTE